jgi:hypothetical protein
MIATNGKWTEHKFDIKVPKLRCRCAGFVESFWFDRNFANFLLWKLTNFDEWKCVSLLWEMNSYNHCFSLPNVNIHGWDSWFFPCVCLYFYARPRRKYRLKSLKWIIFFNNQPPWMVFISFGWITFSWAKNQLQLQSNIICCRWKSSNTADIVYNIFFNVIPSRW